MSRNFIETLESRTLLALTAGFENTFILRVATATATSMQWAPDGRLFVADSRNGEIEVIKLNPSTGRYAQNATPALKLAVDTYAERGIESLVFDPNFATNRYLYIYFTKADPANPNVAGNNAKNRLVRVKTSATNPDVIDPGSITILLDNIPAPGIHNGGAMHFGADGMMYLGIGDAAVGANAQDLSNLNGKVLRLNTNAFNSTGSLASLIPSDNPFVGQAGRRPEIWAYGLRNPFTGAIKPGTNTLYINDVGSSQWEEINDIKKGQNYGWPTAEGNSTNPAFTNPIYAYSQRPNGPTAPRVNAAITGGVFYNGSQFPAQYQGKYFFGDYLRRFIKVLDPATNNVTPFYDSIPDNQEFLDFDVAPDGTLWALSLSGNIHRFRFVGVANRAPVANVSADKTNGLTPLTVNFSGTGSTDPDNDPLTYSWNFDDGTTGAGQTISHTFNTAGVYDVVLTVSDGKGGTNSKTLTITAGNEAPVATISTPLEGTLYRGGETISYSGTGFDNQDGDLPDSAFEWKIVFHHAAHSHPFLDNVNLNGKKDGSFVLPKLGEVDPDQFYRIHLTVTDSGGLKHTSTRDVRPQTSNVTLATNVAGLDLTLDGKPFDGGSSFTGVELMTRSLGAPTQTLNGKTYQFVSWSDAGAATHNIDTPLDDATYTATFREVPTTTVSLRATADAYVRGGTSAGTNFGNATELIVKKTTTSTENLRETYLKFDLSTVASIGSAKLRLVGKLIDAGSTNIPVAVYAVSSTGWSETGITFNNKPAGGATALATKTITDATSRTYEWDLTNYIKAEKAAGRNVVSFVLKATAGSNPFIAFASDEAASNKPALLITPATTSSTALGATHDAYVHSGTPTSNFGNATQLQVKKSSSGFARETYLKFDLSSVASITSAKLRLFGGLSTPWTSAIQTAVYGAANTTWTETGITYSNRPASGATALSTVSIGSTTPGWYEWDLTSYLKAEKLAGRNTVTIVLKNLQSGDPFTVFNSSEAASNKPQLVIT